MTYEQACAKAKRWSAKIDGTIYVVRDYGQYEAATQFDLDTFYAGCGDPVESYYCGHREA
jgi:hypothetical protein